MATTRQEKPTSGKEWRRAREEGVLFHFPSGMIARVRPVNLDTFIRYGSIPDVLSGIVSQLVSGGVDPSKMTGDEYLKLMELQNVFCQTCFIEPRVVMQPAGDDEIGVEDISDEDKGILFAFLGRPASELSSFRPVQAVPVDAVHNEQGGGTPAE